MSVCVFVSVIYSIDSDIERLTPKIPVVTKTAAQHGLKTFVLKNTTKRKYNFDFCTMVSCQVLSVQTCIGTEI